MALRERTGGIWRLEMFLEMLTAERGAAPNTIEAYRRDLSDFFALMTSHGRTSDNITTDDVRRYVKRFG